VAEKLFRDHYAPKRYAFTSGAFKDIPNRADFFDGISQMKPEDWTPGTIDAIATGSADGWRIVIKAVNYDSNPNTLLARFQGTHAPDSATVTIHTVTAALDDENSLAEPNKIHPVETTMRYARDMAFDLAPHTVVVVEIEAN
jgi:alpha-N-arabinofuranosidase